MGIRTLTDLERELDSSYTESVSINTDPSNPFMEDVLSMLGNRPLSLSLRERMSAN